MIGSTGSPAGSAAGWLFTTAWAAVSVSTEAAFPLTSNQHAASAPSLYRRTGGVSAHCSCACGQRGVKTHPVVPSSKLPAPPPGRFRGPRSVPWGAGGGEAPPGRPPQRAGGPPADGNQVGTGGVVG